MTHCPKDNPARRHRRSIRLSGYDYYQPGACFITICTHDRAELFGHIVNGHMQLSPFGEILREKWEKSAPIRAEMEPGASVIMPKHFHAIVHLIDPRNCKGKRPLAPTPALTPLLTLPGK